MKFPGGIYRFIIALLLLAGCSSRTLDPTALSQASSYTNSPTQPLPAFTSIPTVGSLAPAALEPFPSLPIGQYIVYFDNLKGLYAHPLTGAAEYKLSDTRWQGLSPSGKRIGFAGTLYDFAIGGTQDLSFLSGKDCEVESESPDRTHYSLSCADGELYIASAADNSRILISRRSDVDDDFEQPLWSPDGSWVSYIRTTPGSLDHPYFGDRQLFLVNTKCLSEPSRCLENELGPFSDNFFGASGYSYGWSPDSLHIAVPQQEGFGYLIFDLGTLSTRMVDTGPIYVTSLAWSQDGTSIAFTGEDAAGGEGRQVYGMPAFGGAPLQLTQGIGEKIVLFSLALP